MRISIYHEGLRTRFLFNIPIFDLNKINWCTLAFSKQNFKQLQSSGEELLHNKAHSTSRITAPIFPMSHPTAAEVNLCLLHASIMALVA